MWAFIANPPTRGKKKRKAAKPAKRKTAKRKATKKNKATKKRSWDSRKKAAGVKKKTRKKAARKVGKSKSKKTKSRSSSQATRRSTGTGRTKPMAAKKTKKRKTGGKAKRSPRQKAFSKLVAKHGGDTTAAGKAWKRLGSKARPKRKRPAGAKYWPNKPKRKYRKNQALAGSMQAITGVFNLDLVKDAGWLTGGAYATLVLPELVLPRVNMQNVGMVGWASNLVSAGLTGWLIGFLTKDAEIGRKVTLGGMVGALVRIGGDVSKGALPISIEASSPLPVGTAGMGNEDADLVGAIDDAVGAGAYVTGLEDGPASQEYPWSEGVGAYVTGLEGGMGAWATGMEGGHGEDYYEGEMGEAISPYDLASLGEAIEPEQLLEVDY